MHVSNLLIYKQWLEILVVLFRTHAAMLTPKLLGRGGGEEKLRKSQYGA